MPRFSSATLKCGTKVAILKEFLFMVDDVAQNDPLSKIITNHSRCKQPYADRQFFPHHPWRWGDPHRVQMNLFWSAFPILLVLFLMMVLRWGGHQAGPLGWLAGIGITIAFFGLNGQVFWVSQAKGILLSLFVLAILWPALFLYHLVNRMGGIQAIAAALGRAVGEPGLLALVLAWAFSAVLEGLAGFGLPVAIVAPMLVALDINPLTAVAAVAIGHSWTVTFGDVGVIYQTLIALVHEDPVILAPYVAILLGAAAIVCGLAVAWILGQKRRWPGVILLGLWMASVQYFMAVNGLYPLAALTAGLAGIGGGILWGRLSKNKPSNQPPPEKKVFWSAVGVYSFLILLVAALALVKPFNLALQPVTWQARFPAVVTNLGFSTPAAGGQIFRFLLHPGTSILLAAILGYAWFRKSSLLPAGDWKPALLATWRSAGPSSIGILSMVGLAALMDHCGLTLLLAQGLSTAMGSAYPIISPLIGMLGAFATGSNNNSNVLFAVMQKDAAGYLGLNALWMIAAQTTGGSLGSMIAPAKLVVGCSTVGQKGDEGLVLRRTLPLGIISALIIGLITWLLSLFPSP